MRREAHPVAPDRTALVAGLSGLALAVVAAVRWAAVDSGAVEDSVGGADSTWASWVFALASVAGVCLSALAIWSAVKAWLRDDRLTPSARWGAALGLTTMLLVVALGPCGSQSCPG
jgi:uncharacterized membrane protein